MSESTSLFQLEELNQLRSELINYQNLTDELKNEVKMKVMLNNNLHQENEQLMIQLNNSLGEITTLKDMIQKMNTNVDTVNYKDVRIESLQKQVKELDEKLINKKTIINNYHKQVEE